MKRYPLVLLILALTLVAATTTGCEQVTGAAPESEEETLSEDMQSMASMLAADLQMSEQAVRNMMGKHARQWKQPGFLWYLAATMQQRMSNAEKARLFERTERIRQHQRENRWRKVAAFFRKPAPRHPAWRILNDEQRPQFRELLNTYRQQFSDLAEKLRKKEIAREDFLRQAFTLRKQFREDVSQLLTEEQRQALEARRQERKEQRAARMDSVRAAMQHALQLTDERMEQLEALHKRQRETVKALHERFQTGEIDLETLRNELKALHEATDQELQSLLTPEQYETLKIHRALSVIMKQRMQARRAHHGRKRR